MSVKPTLLLITAVLLVSCEQPLAPSSETSLPGQAAQSAQTTSRGLTRMAIPEENPGPPFYARVTSILDQFFYTKDWLAIPFYREPSCVPLDFNLLELFDFPGPDGPGAFACPLLMNGFLLIEPDAPVGTFPRQAVLTGNAVPFWFVSWNAFQAAALDGTLTIRELQALEPLKGTATSYHETLRPREGDHTIVINGRGRLDDGRAFEFHVTHLENQTKSIQIRFR
jgi:hypothetical protein